MFVDLWYNFTHAFIKLDRFINADIIFLCYEKILL